MTVKSIEEIRKAFSRVHRKACGDDDRAYMSIPADPERDADLIVSAAIDELEHLRKRVEHDLPLLGVVLDSVLEGGGASPLLTKVAEQLGLSPEPDHVFAEYEYGWRAEEQAAGEAGRAGNEGHVTVTGTSLCGRELNYGGNWCAVTQDDVEKDLRAGVSLDRFCPKCVAAWPSREQPPGALMFCSLLDHEGGCALPVRHPGPCVTTPQAPRIRPEW